MPLYSRATAVESCLNRLREADEGLDVLGYGDASDEIRSAIAHLEVAVKILNAPDEDVSAEADRG
jgi:hypothetical protein